jgi:hypothetical protein
LTKFKFYIYCIKVKKFNARVQNRSQIMYVLSIIILDLEKHNKTFKNSNKMIAV